MADEDSKDAVRVDRWLWAARAFKSRTLASDACDGGKIDLNGQAAKPHKSLRVGDLVEITTAHGKRQLRVRELSEKRGPAPVARELYDDLTPPLPPARERPQPIARRDAGSGRPTKRERRDIDRWRGW